MRLHIRGSNIPIQLFEIMSTQEDEQVPAAMGTEIQLLFGVQFTDKRFSLCLVAEKQGVTNYALVINVSEYDIRIVDENLITKVGSE